jgi:hypothetical protein
MRVLLGGSNQLYTHGPVDGYEILNLYLLAHFPVKTSTSVPLGRVVVSLPYNGQSVHRGEQLDEIVL